jgi:hypothetical protein
MNFPVGLSHRFNPACMKIKCWLNLIFFTTGGRSRHLSSSFIFALIFGFSCKEADATPYTLAVSINDVNAEHRLFINGLDLGFSSNNSGTGVSSLITAVAGSQHSDIWTVTVTNTGTRAWFDFHLDFFADPFREHVFILRASGRLPEEAFPLRFRLAKERQTL